MRNKYSEPTTRQAEIISRRTIRENAREASRLATDNASVAKANYDLMTGKALEAEQSASEWPHDGDDCSLHCMYLRMAQGFRGRA